MKKVNRYQVRYYEGNDFSQYVGIKGKLLTYRKAMNIVKRLKRMGVDAFTDKWILNA